MTSNDKPAAAADPMPNPRVDDGYDEYGRGIRHDAKIKSLRSKHKYAEIIVYCRSVLAEIKGLPPPISDSELGLQAALHTEISICFSILGQPDKALAAMLKAHRTAQKLPYQWLELYFSYSILSRRYNAVGDHENAKRCLLKAAASILERNTSRLVADMIQGIARIDAETGNKDAAEVLDTFARDLASVGSRVYIPRRTHSGANQHG